jgi:aldehyde:ferredoxin oxidoreductase
MKPLEAGPTKGQVLTKEELNDMLNDYYDICGWDNDTGIPTKEKLKELELSYVIEQVYS